MTPELHGKLQAELDRLTANNTAQDKARFADGFWRNVRTWDARFADRAQRTLALDDLKEAHLARILVTEHPGSPQYAQALNEDLARRTTKLLGTQRDKVA